MPEMESRSIHSIHPSSRLEEKRSSKCFLVKVLSMCGGDGDNSYSSNSLLQRRVLLKAKPVLVKSTREMVMNLDFPKCIKLADFGCSSGPNTFMTMSEIVNTINVLYEQNNKNPPEIDCCLNDLSDNDFNTTFKYVPFFNKKISNNGSCFVSGVPGSFYSRLFPHQTLHFVHSSYSLHWTSKVPDGLEDNKWGVYITTSSPLNANKLYFNQFRRDFTAFLEMRSKEMVCNGRMVLTLNGRNNNINGDPLYRDCCHFWTLLSKSLRDLVSEGVISASKVDSFNVPFYDPSEEEVKEIVKKEGSFVINEFEIHGFDLSDSNHEEDYRSETKTKRSKEGQKEADCIRAISEPMLVAHFGHSIIDALFNKYAYHVSQHATCTYKTTVTLVVSLVRT